MCESRCAKTEVITAAAMAGLEHDRLPMLDAVGFHKHFATLTRSQRDFIALLNEWFRGGRREFLFVLVTGGPGCGKTHAVVETLRYLDLRVAKMSFTARLARKIGGATVHKTLFPDSWSRNALTEVWNGLEHNEDVEECLKISSRLADCISCDRPVDVVVVDEIGMLPFWLTYRIGAHFRSRRPSVAMICMGDVRQLRPVKSRISLFHIDFDRYFPGSKKIEMNESKRFTPEYEKIIDRLRELMVDEVEENEEENHPLIRYVSETFPVVDCLTQEMMSRARFVLAFKNETVNACNEFYLNVMMAQRREFVFPVLERSGWRVSKDAEPTRLREGCRAMVTQNNCGEGVCNGSSVQFLDYDRSKDVAVCRRVDTGEIVRVRRSAYNGGIPLVPGFAITIHKFQGETIDDDDILMCFDKSKDVNLIYTALSRVRDVSQIMAVVL